MSDVVERIHTEAIDNRTLIGWYEDNDAVLHVSSPKKQGIILSPSHRRALVTAINSFLDGDTPGQHKLGEDVMGKDITADFDDETFVVHFRGRALEFRPPAVELIRDHIYETSNGTDLVATPPEFSDY